MHPSFTIHVHGQYVGTPGEQWWAKVTDFKVSDYYEAHLTINAQRTGKTRAAAIEAILAFIDGITVSIPDDQKRAR